MGNTPQLIESGERIRLEDGAELFLDDRGLDGVPGWRYRDEAGAPARTVDLWEAFGLCGPRLARHVTALTVALICDLHERPSDDGPSDARAAKHRLTKQLSEAVHRMARASDG
jgi:hypothetical protein